MAQEKERQKVLISYRYTGETPENLATMIGAITTSLEHAGFEAVSSLSDEGYFKETGMRPGRIVECMCRRIVDHDILLVVVKSEDKSEGMLLEVGYRNALSDLKVKHLPLVLAVKRGVYTCMSEIADRVLRFENLDDLYQQLVSFAL